MNFRNKSSGYVITISLTILFSMFSLTVVHGETSYLGEKLLAYVKSLPESFALIYSELLPINDNNYNYWLSNSKDRDIPSPGVILSLYVKTPEKRIIEQFAMPYDISISKDVGHHITVGNQEKTIYYIPKGNEATIYGSYSIFIEETSTILGYFNPLAGTDHIPEAKDFRRNNYSTNGNEVKFPSNFLKDKPTIIYSVFVMPGESNLCPPIESYSIWVKKGEITQRRYIENKEYTLSNGQKIIFPKRIIKTWGDNDRNKKYYDILYFDLLNDGIKDELFQFEIPDGAKVFDQRCEISFIKNSPVHKYLKDEYPTKFSHFGFSLEKVKEMIKEKIDEDRQKNARYK